MSTELAVVGAEPQIVRNDLVQWAEEARQAASIATSLAKTPFVPQSLRDRDPGVTSANITAAILTGRELGLEPMSSLRSMDIIQGVPALRAVALRALVQSAGHTVWLQESTETRSIVCGIRRGDDHEQRSTWTLDRANKLGLTSRDQWRKQPGAMLVARATSELCRLIAADVILGVPYSVEELVDDDASVTEAALERAPARKRTAQRRPVQAAPVEPEFEEPSFDEPAAAEPAPDEPTDPQHRKMFATLGDLGITDRGERLTVLGQIVDRKLTSSGDLTRAETATVIDTLDSFHGDGERLRGAFELRGAVELGGDA